MSKAVTFLLCEATLFTGDPSNRLHRTGAGGGGVGVESRQGVGGGGGIKVPIRRDLKASQVTRLY